MHIREFPRPLRMFLLTKGLAYIQFAFIKFLINIYLWRITESISFLVLYNVVFETAHALAYVPGGQTCKERNRFLPMRTGLILNIVFLALLLLLEGAVVKYVIPLAFIGGFAHGLYWCSDNLLKFDLTRTTNRLRFAATHQILQFFANAVIPLVASIIVIADGAVFSAYGPVFLLAAFFSLLTFGSTFLISEEKNFKAISFNLTLHGKGLLRNKNVRLAMLSTYLMSIADVLPILLGLLLFFSTGTELSIGSYQFITVMLSMASMYAVGRCFSNKDYGKLLIYGGLVNFALIFILLFRQDFVAVLIYGMLSSIFMVTNVPFNPLILDAMASACRNREECIQIRVEYIAMAELFLGAGIITGFFILLLIHHYPSKLAIGIVAVMFGLTRFLANIVLARIRPVKTIDIDDLN